MKKVFGILLIGALCLGAKDYKVGDTLSDREGVEFFKNYAKRPVQQWPQKKLSIDDVPKGKDGELIRYGIAILSNTEGVLGPKSKLKMTSNEVNCKACHMEDDNGLPGTKKYVLPFINAINNFPKLDIETMKIISLQDRIRGMGGTDSHRMPDDSREMRAIIAYFEWLKKAYGIKDGVRVEGTYLAEMQFPNRSANPVKGKDLYMQKCSICHGEDGKGALNENYAQGGGHMYPSLLIWPDGGHMAMIPVLARFLRSAMPFGASAEHPELTPSEAIDLAAYLNTGFLRMPMMSTENRAGLDKAYSKSPSLKPEYFSSPQQQLDPQEYFKAKYGPWKNPNYFPGE